jgi:hypothetical protein
VRRFQMLPSAVGFGEAAAGAASSHEAGAGMGCRWRGTRASEALAMSFVLARALASSTSFFLYEESKTRTGCRWRFCLNHCYSSMPSSSTAIAMCQYGGRGLLAPDLQRPSGLGRRNLGSVGS